MLIKSQNQIYNSKFFLYQYNDNNFRLVLNKYTKEKGWEEIGTSKKTDKNEVERISLSRTKRHIRELALCNNFTHFATVTVNSDNADRFSLTECQNLIRKKLHAIKRKNKDFAFLFITEEHKNGAFHFHGLVKNLDFYINKNGYLSNSVFDTIGFNSFSKIKDFEKTCNYITKYITKKCVKNENNQIYFCSRGLKKASKYEIEPVDIDWSYQNDFCKILDINLHNCKPDILIKLLNISEKK